MAPIPVRKLLPCSSWVLIVKGVFLLTTTYIASNATVVGDVVLKENANIWYGAVLRGDHGTITVGESSNIQDNAVVHEKTTIGNFCTIGHSAIVHGCTIRDYCLIGMGAIVLDGAILGNHCMVGAGALVTGKTDAPDGSLLLGSPAKIVRSLTPEEISGLEKNAQDYVNHAEAQLPHITK